MSLEILLVVAGVVILALLPPGRWIIGRSYNLLRNRALPGLPDLGGAGSVRTRKGRGAPTDLKRSSTAPIARYSTVSAADQIKAIREGDYGDLMLFGRHLDGFHVLLCAASRSGKSQALLMAFLAWLYLARALANSITIDPKAEFYDEHKNRGGKHYTYSVMKEHPDSIVSAINIIPNQQAATGLIETLTANDKGYFRDAARTFFGNLCRVTNYRSVVEVYDYLYDYEALEQLAATDKQLQAALYGKNEKRVDDIIDTLRVALSLLDDPLIRRVFDSEGAEQPNFAEGGIHVNVCIPLIPSFARAFSPWATALIDQLVNLATGCGRDTYVLADEGASFMDLDNIADYFAISAGAGIRVILSVQDLSQLAARIGQEKTRSIVNNSTYRITGMLGDKQTAHLLSEQTGEVEVERLVEGKPRAAGMWAGTDQDDRRYDRNIRYRLTSSNEQSLSAFEFFLDQGQKYPIEHLRPEPYGSYSHKLPNGWPEDKRGVPPQRTHTQQTQQTQITSNRQETAPPSPPPSPMPNDSRTEQDEEAMIDAIMQEAMDNPIRPARPAQTPDESQEPRQTQEPRRCRTCGAPTHSRLYTGVHSRWPKKPRLQIRPELPNVAFCPVLECCRSKRTPRECDTRSGR